MGEGDSQCVHSLLKAWSSSDTQNSQLILNQLFGNADSQQIWRQSCTQHSSDAVPSILKELADIARVAVGSMEASDGKMELIRTWCQELPLAIAQYCVDRQQLGASGKRQAVKVDRLFPDQILVLAQRYFDSVAARGPGSARILKGDEPIHLLIHLLSLSLPDDSAAEEHWTLATLVSAIMLASNPELFQGSAVWTTLLGLVGMCVSRQSLSQTGVQRCVLVAHLATTQIDMLLPASQKATVALVYSLHLQGDCDLRLCIEDLVQKCATTGSTGTTVKTMSAYVICDISKASPVLLSPSSVRSVKSLLGDPNSAARKAWGLVAKRPSVYDPLEAASYGGPVSSIGRVLAMRSCPIVWSGVASKLAREMNKVDALLVVRCLSTDWSSQVSDDAQLAELGMSGSVLDIAVGSLRAVMPAGAHGDVFMDIQTAVATSALVLRSSGTDEIASTTALLLSVLRSYLDSDTGASHTEIPVSSVYWILEFLYHLLVAASHAPDLLTTVDTQLLLLRAAIASSNLGFAVFICQYLVRSHRKSTNTSHKLATYTQMLSAAPWGVVGELLSGEAGDMIDSFAELQSLESQLSKVEISDTLNDPTDRLRRYDLDGLGIRTGDVARTDLTAISTYTSSRSACDFLRQSEHGLRMADRFFDFAVLDNVSYANSRKSPVLTKQAVADRLRFGAGATTAAQIRSVRWLLDRGHHQQALTALQAMDVDTLDSRHLDSWWGAYSDTVLLRASVSHAVTPVLWKNDVSERSAVDVVRAGISANDRIDFIFAQSLVQTPSKFVSDIIQSPRSISVDSLASQGVTVDKARQAVLYLCKDSLTTSDRSQLYSESILHGHGKIRFSATGTLDPAATLVSDISQNPIHAPRLTADSLTTSAVRQLAPFIPQLFSLLSFREPQDPGAGSSTAADSALCILELLAESSPDLVVFHAVVASQSLGSATHGHQRVAHLLRHFSPEQVADIRLFLKSVEQVMVLPQERIRWQCLKSKSTYTKALVVHLRRESAQNTVQASLAPLYGLFDDYSKLAPTTAAEKDLVTVIPQLRSLVDQLAASDIGLRAAESIWNELFMALNTPAKLSVAYASPVLAEFSTAIPIPSLVDNGEPRYLSHIGSSLRVIGSKTRPKLLTLHLAGTTGEVMKERYILKGNEDLRIDETVIQSFMRLNGVVRSAEHSGPLGDSAARQSTQLATYNVVPTGRLGGLIQVVDSAPSLFFIYSQFAKAKFASATNGSDTRSQLPTTMQIYKQCVARILKSNGVPANTPSNKWPAGLQAEVYETLVSTIPPNLLHRQLMGAALSPAHLFLATQNMARSLAMSSMAGYVLGLGDRHLDNLLVDVSRGQMISIDFNVCFDFGGISRVPELVPFRMTPVLQYLCGSPTKSPEDAMLGNWAVANSRIFAHAAAATLRCARMDKDTLVNAIARRVQFQPFQEWSDIETAWLKNRSHGRTTQQPSSVNSPITLDSDSNDRDRWLSPDSGDASNQPSQTLPTSGSGQGSPKQSEATIRVTGLCPLSAFLPNGQVNEVCLAESAAGWRIAQAAVGRMMAKLEFCGSGTDSDDHDVVVEQVLVAWSAAVSKENLMKMYVGWAPWI